MFSSLSIVYGGVMSEHCVRATGLGLGTLYVYTHVRIYTFSIYLVYAADVMPNPSLGRETKGRL